MGSPCVDVPKVALSGKLRSSRFRHRMVKHSRTRDESPNDLVFQFQMESVPWEYAPGVLEHYREVRLRREAMARQDVSGGDLSDNTA